jgi:UDP-N-acetylmuramoyl-tripeptide--D-alanyl-D-alanine ligase
MMAGILTSGGYRVLKTEGNLNNLIGVPLMLFRLGPKMDMAVLELGANRFGEIDRLAEISMPQVGIITSVGKAHLQFFKSLSGVSRAKAELVRRLKRDDAAVLNADDPYVVEIGRKSPARKIFFGFKKGSHVRCLSAKEKGVSGTAVSVDVLGRRMGLEVPLPGFHNVSNALAAIAGACAIVGAVSRSEIQEGLRSTARLPGRFRIIKKKDIREIYFHDKIGKYWNVSLKSAIFRHQRLFYIVSMKASVVLSAFQELLLNN